MNSEIYDKAMSVLVNRRARAVSENDMHIQEINSKIPQIHEINDVLFNTGKELIQIISEGKSADTQNKIEMATISFFFIKRPPCY